MITLTGTLVMYYLAVISGTSVADYFAFNSAYGMVAGAFMGMAGIAMTLSLIHISMRPIMVAVSPLLKWISSPMLFSHETKLSSCF